MKTIIPLLCFVTLMLAECSASEDGEKNPCRPDLKHHGRRGPHKVMIFGEIKRFQKDYRLTQKQIQSIEAINDSYREKHQLLRNQHHPEMERLQQMLLSDPVDFIAVEEQLKLMSKYDVKRRIFVIRQRIEIEGVLTDEQKNKMRRQGSLLMPVKGPF